MKKDSFFFTSLIGITLDLFNLTRLFCYGSKSLYKSGYILCSLKVILQSRELNEELSFLFKLNLFLLFLLPFELSNGSGPLLDKLELYSSDGIGIG